jgi:predicted ABC-type ATPase
MRDRFSELLIQELDEERPILLVIAGPNGAGKSTFFETVLRSKIDIPAENHIDPDVVEKMIRQSGVELSDLQFSQEAQKVSEKERDRLLRHCEDISLETVFSHESKLELLSGAKDRGYLVVVVFVVLDSPELSVERVGARVARKGHPVPPQKIMSRYPRVLANLKEATKIADLLLVLDNSSDEPYVDVALYHRGNLECWEVESWLFSRGILES